MKIDNLLRIFKGEKLRNKFFRFFLLPNMIVMLAVFSIVILLSVFQIRKAVEREIQESSHRYLQTIKTDLENALFSSKTLATVIPQLDHTSVSNILKEFLINNSNFTCVYLFLEPTPSNRTIQLISWIHEDSNYYYQEHLDYRPEDFDFYRVPKSTLRDYVTAPYYWVYNRPQGKKHYILTVCIPIIRNGRFIGITGVDFSLEHLQEVVKSVRIYPDTYAFLISSSGVLVSHPMTSLIGKTFREIYENHQELVHAAEQAEKGLEFSYPSRNLVNHELSTIYWTPFQVGQVKEPWYFGMTVPFSVITKKLQGTILILVGLGLVTTAILLLLLVVLSKNLYRDIGRAIDTIGNQIKQTLKGGKSIKTIRPSELPSDFSAIEEGLMNLSLELSSAWEKLKASEKRLGEIIDFLPDPTFAIDQERKIISWNHAMEKLTGVPREAMIGNGEGAYGLAFYKESRPMLIDMVFENNDELRRRYPQVEIHQGVIEAVGYEPTIGEGGTYLFGKAAPLMNPQGELIGAIEIIHDISRLKRAEIELRENEKKYRTLFETAGEAICLLKDNLIMDCNPHFEHLFELTREELIGSKIDSYSPESQPSGVSSETMAQEIIGRVLNGEHAVFEWTHLRKDGSIFIVEVSMKLLSLTSGNLMLSVMHDLTERIHAEEAVRESEEKLRALVESADEGIVMIDRNGIIVEWNPANEKISGFSRDETIGQPYLPFLLQIIPPEHRSQENIDRITRIYNKRINSDQPNARNTIEGEFIRKDGTPRIFRQTTYSVRTRNGNLFAAISVDITDQKRNEQALKTMNETLEDKIKERTRELNALNETLIQSNHELNSTLETLHETQDSLIQSEKLAALGQLIAGIAHELNTPLGAIVSSNQSIIQIIRNQLPDTARFISGLSPTELSWFDSVLTSCLNKINLLEGSNSLRQRRKALEEKFLSLPIRLTDSALDQLLELGLENEPSAIDFISGNPNSRKILDALSVLVSIRKLSEIISIAADKSSHVVSALQYYSRQDTPDDESLVEISKEIDIILTLYTNQIKYGVEVVKNYLSPGRVRGSRNKLNQIWMNLIQNALQAMEYKGVLTLTIEEDARWVTVSVGDNGPGIPPHLRGKIFEPFFTTKKAGEGTGLGLDICRKMVDKHEGKIELESEPGRTVFRVKIPATSR